MTEDRHCLSQKKHVIAVSEHSKQIEENKRLFRELGAIVNNADDHAQLIAMTNSGLSIVQAIQKIVENKHV